jgi:hypothetical protein
MNTVIPGLVTLANGLWAMLTAIANPYVIGVALMVASAVWLALIETEELDRSGTKPIVGRH